MIKKCESCLAGFSKEELLGNCTCMPEEKECEYGHNCTSRCQNDVDCPCQNEHYCSMSEGQHSFGDCEGECPIHYGKSPESPDFSPEQEEVIERLKANVEEPI